LKNPRPTLIYVFQFIIPPPFSSADAPAAVAATRHVRVALASWSLVTLGGWAMVAGGGAGAYIARVASTRGIFGILMGSGQVVGAVLAAALGLAGGCAGERLALASGEGRAVAEAIRRRDAKKRE
jgi:hypothetical protein